MTTRFVSPEYRNGLVYGVKMPVKPNVWRESPGDQEAYESALAQARKDGLLFEDQVAIKRLLVKHNQCWEAIPEGSRFLNLKEEFYLEISFEVSEVKQVRRLGSNDEWRQVGGFSGADMEYEYRTALRIVTKP